MPSTTANQKPPTAKMNTSSVNRTNLHPSGVEYVLNCCCATANVPGLAKVIMKHVIAN